MVRGLKPRWGYIIHEHGGGLGGSTPPEGQNPRPPPEAKGTPTPWGQRPLPTTKIWVKTPLFPPKLPLIGQLGQKNFACGSKFCFFPYETVTCSIFFACGGHIFFPYVSMYITSLISHRTKHYLGFM